jgi:hypothetical protein
MTTNTNGNLFEMEEQTPIQSKKDMILSLYNSGTTEVEAIAAVSGAKPSYVGSVLHQAGLIDNYFDLYTSTNYPMNIYSKHFRGNSASKTYLRHKEAFAISKNRIVILPTGKTAPGSITRLKWR